MKGNVDKLLGLTHLAMGDGLRGAADHVLPQAGCRGRGWGSGGQGVEREGGRRGVAIVTHMVLLGVGLLVCVETGGSLVVSLKPQFTW